MKFSEVTTEDVANFLRLDNDGDYLLGEIIPAAKQYIVSYTGQDEKALDECPDVTIAMMVLCQDMYDNRSMYADRTNVNKVIETILGMYRVNLL